MIGIGVCTPSSCSPKKVMEIANSTLITTRNVTVVEFLPPNLMCSTGRKFNDFNGLQIFAV